MDGGGSAGVEADEDGRLVRLRGNPEIGQVTMELVPPEDRSSTVTTSEIVFFFKPSTAFNPSDASRMEKESLYLWNPSLRAISIS